LKSLSLHRTKSKKPSLASLARFTQLRELRLEGQAKDIEVVSGLQKLRKLTLRSVTTADLSYLRSLPKLWFLDLELGGLGSLSAIAGMESIEYLEVWQVKGLTEVDAVGALPRLQYLFLQSLARVKKLPSFARSRALRRVHLQNMRGLADVSSLATAPALAELVVYDGRHQAPEDFEPVLAGKTLRRALGGFGSQRKNARFLELAIKHGVGPVTGPFKFR
jgi:hypothetical protein